MIEITVGICESFKKIGIDLSEGDLRRFEKALYERGLNVAPRALSPPEPTSALQGDLAEMLRALDLGDHARPQSPHEVFQECIAEVKRLRAMPLQDHANGKTWPATAVEDAWLEGYLDGRRGASRHQNDREWTTSEGAWQMSDTRRLLAEQGTKS